MIRAFLSSQPALYRRIALVVLLLGLLGFVSLGAAYLVKPGLVTKALRKGPQILYGKVESLQNRFDPRMQPLTAAEIAAVVPPFKHTTGSGTPPGRARIGQREFPDPYAAISALQPGDELLIGPGVYSRGAVIKASNVTIVGDGAVVFERAAVQGKAMFVIDGDGVTLRNIECRFVSVSDRNGACVRLQGRDLKLDHVYFHDSQSGLMTGSNNGRVTVTASRFENLGANWGKAHGIYAGRDGELIISDSLLLRSRELGHEVKSRARRTVIENSVIATLDGTDSRLVDVPNGGELIIRDSLLGQGPRSSNQQLLGYGHEGLLYEQNQIVISNNVVLLERKRGNKLLDTRGEVTVVSVSDNVIVGPGSVPAGRNVRFQDRKRASLAPYPALPHPLINGSDGK